MLDRSLMEEVKLRNPIEDVVGRYVDLTKKGRNYEALCPFHTERTPSFKVSPEMGTYHCFGCGERGDAINFVQKIEGDISFREVLDRLDGGLGIDLSPEEAAEINKIARMREILNLANLHYQRNLFSESGQGALEYLHERGLRNGVIKAFGVGYSLDSFNSLNGFLIREGVSRSEMLESGLARESEKSSGLYDYFRGRVMFPIRDESGRVYGFAGRVLGDSKPKYLNSPDSEWFDKSRMFYGIDLAKEAIRRVGKVALMEGYTDVMHSHQAGIDYAVALGGTAFGQGHVSGLRRFRDAKVILCGDGDSAGRDSGFKAGKLLFGRKPTFVCLLPEGKDPADVLALGGDLEEMLEDSIPFSNFYFNYRAEGRDLRSPEEQQVFLTEIADDLRDVPRHTRKLLANFVVENSGMDKEGVNDFLRGMATREVSRKTEYWEKSLLSKLAFVDGEVARNFIGREQGQLVIEDFSSPETRALFLYLTKANRPTFLNGDLFNPVSPTEAFTDGVIGSTGDLGVRREKLLSLVTEIENNNGLYRPTRCEFSDIERAIFLFKIASLEQERAEFVLRDSELGENPWEILDRLKRSNDYYGRLSNGQEI